MRTGLVSLEFFETYYYANVVQNVLSNPSAYIRGLNDWHEDREVELFLKPFQKWSLLHDFAHFLVEQLMFEALDDVTLDAVETDPKFELWVDSALRHHGLPTIGFRKWLADTDVSIDDVNEDHVRDYHRELGLAGELETLLEKISNEIFFLLFGNRSLLEKLNSYAAGIVGNMSRCDLAPECSSLLARDGVPARAYIPQWARRAVFYRDRGMCASCSKDLTGIVNLSSLKHFDHIISLARGGVNDVTNIQLLCEACNLGKGPTKVSTSRRYEAWYT